MSSELMKHADRVIAQTYQRFSIALERGEGCTLWDTSGRAYTDFVAGIAVCNLGHAHPKVAKALCDQAQILFHVSNLYYTAPQVALAMKLVEKSFADRVFFCNSGAEANEAAIKLARRYFYEKNEKDRYRIVAMKQSFHGRTMAALSATGQEKIRKGFDPVLNGFDFVPFNDIDALKVAVGPQTCAVLLEPIQGEGGVRCPAPDYLKAVRRLCDETGTLLMFDEIQTGIGRTGKWFAYEHFGITPDVMTLAKALGNGLPIGAMLATETVSAAFGPGAHASTFGGTPIVTAAANEVLNVLDNENIVALGAQVGAFFKSQLVALRQRHACIRDVRGMGLLLAIELDQDGAPFVDACAKEGFLINCIQGNTLRFVPPLIVTEAQVRGLIACLDKVLP